jgi:hypothetical protein
MCAGSERGVPATIPIWEMRVGGSSAYDADMAAMPCDRRRARARACARESSQVRPNAHDDARSEIGRAKPPLPRIDGARTETSFRGRVGCVWKGLSASDFPLSLSEIRSKTLEEAPMQDALRARYIYNRADLRQCLRTSSLCEIIPRSDLIES